MNIKQIFHGIRSSGDEFTPFYELENDFKRIALLWSVAGLVVSPIFCLLVYNTEVSKVYFYIGLSNIICFPVYILLFYFIQPIKDKLVYVLIGHLFVLTYFAYTDLLAHDFELFHFFCFYSLYTVFIYVIQRLYSAILYSFYVFALLLYGFQHAEVMEVSKSGSIGLFLVIALCAILVLASRRRMINSVEGYSEYLKKIVNNSGIGYVLFRFVNDKPIMIDHNQESIRMLGTTSDNLLIDLFTKVGINEIPRLAKMKLGFEWNWSGVIHQNPELKALKLDVSVISLKNGLYWLMRMEDVSDEIREKELLEQREQKYRNLYYRNQAGVFTADLTSTILDHNQAFEEMFEGEVTKKDKLFEGLDNQEWKEILELITNNENLRNYQIHFTLKNGRTKWFIFNWYLDSSTNNIEGRVIDVSEVQKTASALSQSEQKYRLIFEETNDAILLLEDDKIIDSNRRGIQLFGLIKKELLTKTLWDLSYDHSKDSRQEYDKQFRKIKMSRHSKFDWNFISNNERIEAEVAVIELSIDNKTYYQCVIHDQTELNQSIRDLEKNRKSFKNILDNTPEGIIILTPEKILYSNPEIHKILSVDEIDTRHIFIGDAQQEFDKVLGESNEKKKMHNGQYTIMDGNGERRTIELTLVPTSFEEQEATMLIIKDISVQQQLSREKLRAELAEETNKKLAMEIKERINAEKKLQEQLLRSSAIFESSSNTLLLTLDTTFTISSFNTHCQNYFWYLTESKMNQGENLLAFFGHFLEQRDIRLFKRVLNRVLKGESRQMEVFFRPKRKLVWVEIFMNPIFDTEGRVTEISLVSHDISEKKKTETEIVESLKEKEVLLKEIHHRVKNNLQVISSILNLQSSFINDKQTLDILEESRNRIRTMAIIHENLYQTTNFSSISFTSYLENLCHNLVASYHLYSGKVKLRMEMEKIDLVLDQAIPCGLLVNELITNALKYAFPGGMEGEIYVRLENKQERLRLIIEDNGVGVPGDIDILDSDSLGLQLVSTLVEQLEGEIQVENSGGIKYLVTFDRVKP